MKITLIAGSLLVLSACATEPFPSKRPLTQEAIDKIAETNVVVVENNVGVGVTWFMQDSSAAGAQYGLIGALTTAVLDAIVNAGPSGRADRAANEVSEVMTSEMLNFSLVDSLTAVQPAEDADKTGIAIATVETRQSILNKDAVDAAVEITTNYFLSEDGGAIRVNAYASYSNASIDYVTPYVFEKSVPKSELSGPLYKNAFTYDSDRFPFPTLTPELKVKLVTAIEESFKGENGKIPVEGDDDFKKMNKQLKNAQDDELSKSEALVFLAAEWLQDDGAPIKIEIERAHAFITKYVLADLNSTAVPSLDATDTLVDTLEDGRTIRIVGSGRSAGAYISSPGKLDSFTTFGNAVGYSDDARDLEKALRAERKQAKNTATN